jgi:drug/metabolite transporter (DMT)-like permease
MAGSLPGGKTLDERKWIALIGLLGVLILVWPAVRAAASRDGHLLRNIAAWAGIFGFVLAAYFVYHLGADWGGG